MIEWSGNRRYPYEDPAGSVRPAGGTTQLQTAGVGGSIRRGVPMAAHDRHGLATRRKQASLRTRSEECLEGVTLRWHDSKNLTHARALGHARAHAARHARARAAHLEHRLASLDRHSPQPRHQVVPQRRRLRNRRRFRRQ